MAAKKLTVLPVSCMKCPHHKVVRDPDPDDWFCDDDCAVLCTLEAPPKKSRFEHQAVTTACRPYNTEKETTPVPNWCQLRKTLPEAKPKPKKEK
jgi:hypothetical protein